MEDFINGSISENTTDPQPQVPDIENGSDGETSVPDNEETGGGGEKDDTETSVGAPSGGESGAPVENLGGNDSPTLGGVSPDDIRQAVDGLNAVADALADGTPEYKEILESVRSLVDIMTAQAEHADSPTIPISGYDGYSYPLYVQYRIYPTALGKETGTSATYDTPETFETDYARMWETVESGNLAYFYIEYVRDSEGQTVYDVNYMPEESEETEPDTFRDDILSALSDLHEDLQLISAEDMEFYEQYSELQEQYKEMQELNTELQYHMLASNIAIGFTLLLTLGYTIAHGFLQRMKVG